jgi:hypothetical protein
MATNDVKKTVVITKLGLYEWNVMPFRLTNANNTLSWTMADIFKDWSNQFLRVFVDNVNIHNGTWFDHLQHILVLQMLVEVNLKFNLSTCCFGFKSTTLSGHVVNCTSF